MYKNAAPASLVETRDAERGDQALLDPLASHGLERRAEGILAQQQGQGVNEAPALTVRGRNRNQAPDVRRRS